MSAYSNIIWGSPLQNTRSSQSIPKPSPLSRPTAYYLKFGSTGERFLPEGKSGLTPLKTPPYHLTREEWAYRRRIREYQLSHLDPFTSRDLMLSDALYDASATPSDLKGIHQIFAPENWDDDLPAHLASYPLGHGRSGQFWRADHPDVWRVLQPVLALATKFIENCHVWPWWDAIISGPRSQIPALPGRFRFHARPSFVSSSQAARLSIRDCINGLVDSPRALKFTIGNGACDPEDGLCIDGAWKAMYVQRFLRRWDSARVFLSYDRLAILLFCDLTVEERLITQFDLAICLFHELAHAVGAEVAPLEMDEPYYEGESAAELGHSMINAIFGGRAFAFGQESRESYFHLRQQPPLGLIYQAGFPTREDVIEGEDILDPDLIAGYGAFTEWAIPVKWISDVQKEVFWTEHVTKYGLDALRPLPLGLGVEITKAPGQETSAEFRVLDPRSDIGLPTEFVQRACTRNDMLLSAISDLFDEEDRYTLEDYQMFYGKEIGKGIGFRTIVDVDETFDPNMPSTQRIKEIRNLLNFHQVDLALDTMVQWTPANLVLNYIHRLLPGQVSPEDFEHFLIYCQSHRELFEFRRKGGGEMRTIPIGWAALPPKMKVKKPSGYRDLKAQVYKYKNRAFQITHGLFDIDADIFYHRIDRFNRLDGGPPISREAFDRGMAYWDYKNTTLIRGPPGIIRRVARGNQPFEEDVDEEDAPAAAWIEGG